MEGLPLVTLMSGLVEILESVWFADDKLLVFIVKSLDKTEMLFRQGALAANPIQRYRRVGQPLCV